MPMNSLKERRKAAGLTQQALATRAGCSLAYVTVLENGYTPRGSNVLPRILRVIQEAERDERAQRTL